jgi:hypothetical protein
MVTGAIFSKTVGCELTSGIALNKVSGKSAMIICTRRWGRQAPMRYGWAVPGQNAPSHRPDVLSGERHGIFETGSHCVILSKGIFT